MDSRRELVDKLKQSNEVRVTVTGRKTKKKLSTPVWFVLEGDSKVLLVPMRGSDTNWFKNLAGDLQIGLGVDEVESTSKAKVVREPREVEKVLDKFRAKYRRMWSEAYYVKRDLYVEVAL